MNLEELQQELNLSEEQVETVKKFQQSTEDRIRTDYSQKLKDANSELEKLKPHEKSDTEIELEQLKKELAETKFQKSLKEIGVDDTMAKFIKSDANMEELKTFVDSFKENKKDFVPTNKNNVNDNSITKEQFGKMSYADKEKLYSENPQLFEMLSK